MWLHEHFTLTLLSNAREYGCLCFSLFFFKLLFYADSMLTECVDKNVFDQFYYNLGFAKHALYTRVT